MYSGPGFLSGLQNGQIGDNTLLKVNNTVAKKFLSFNLGQTAMACGTMVYTTGFEDLFVGFPAHPARKLPLEHLSVVNTRLNTAFG